MKFSNQSSIRYLYDPMGNRIGKRERTATGVTSTWYVRDAKARQCLGLLFQQDLAMPVPIFYIGSNAMANYKQPPIDLPIGLKQYELTNHLGNVLSTISDFKVPVDIGNNGSTDYFTANVISQQSYYPFGMLMPERKFSVTNNGYRFGFNGKENDNEVKGDGNSLDFGARIYDPRLGKFLSTDKFSWYYPDLTPYAFAGNSPIIAIDPDGNIIKIVGDATFTYQTEMYLALLKLTDKGKIILASLESSSQIYYLNEATNRWNTEYDQTSNNLYYDPTPWKTDLEGGAYNGLIGLSHELWHAYSDETNSYGVYHDQVINRLLAEKSAVSFQNYVTSVYSCGDFRKKYSDLGTIFPYEGESYFNSQKEKIKFEELNTDYSTIGRDATLVNIRPIIIPVKTYGNKEPDLGPFKGRSKASKNETKSKEKKTEPKTSSGGGRTVRYL